MTFRRGDVVLVRYPDSNLTTYKKRPALVVQADALGTGLPQCIVACITSNLGRTGPTRVVVRRTSPEGQAMGLLTDSVVMTDNLATVLDREIDKVIGRCPAMAPVDAALRRTLGL
jgi:mRNA interferase MazF